jgi:hypothetical protein
MSKEAMNHAIDVLKDSQDYKMGRAMTVEAVEALEEALAKQEQGEPVAWANRELTCFSKKETSVCIKPLAWIKTTTPQQRTWVGLTDEDLAVCGDEDDVLLARYWERVCKEKNT